MIHCQPKIRSGPSWLGAQPATIITIMPPIHGPSVVPPINPNCSSAKARVSLRGGKASASNE